MSCLMNNDDNDQLITFNQQINRLGFVWARRMASEDMMTKWLQECSIGGHCQTGLAPPTGAIDYKDHIYK